jgi:hypothetical protein
MIYRSLFNGEIETAAAHHQHLSFNRHMNLVNLYYRASSFAPFTNKKARLFRTL